MKDNEIVDIIESLQNASNFEVKETSIYFNTHNWYYIKETHFFAHLECNDLSYGIHLATNNAGERVIAIIIEEKGSVSFNDTLLDEQNYYQSKYYTEEEEHFMDSTIKSIKIPFSVMKAVQDFIEKHRS